MWFYADSAERESAQRMLAVGFVASVMTHASHNATVGTLLRTRVRMAKETKKLSGLSKEITICLGAGVAWRTRISLMLKRASVAKVIFQVTTVAGSVAFVYTAEENVSVKTSLCNRKTASKVTQADAMLPLIAGVQDERGSEQQGDRSIT